MSLTTLTSVDVPIPTDKLGSTFKDILSPVDKLWGTLVVTVDSMLSTFDVTESNTVSNWYLPRRASPTFDDTFDMSVMKTSELLIWVLIPMWLISLLTANTVSGKVKLFAPLSALTSKRSLTIPVGVENLSFWFVWNGWLLIKICFIGRFLVICLPPKSNVLDNYSPSAVPTPTVSNGLKNTFWLIFELKKGILLEIVNLSGR